MSDTVLYELDGHVATITYNRPDALNAINAQGDDVAGGCCRGRPSGGRGERAALDG